MHAHRLHSIYAGFTANPSFSGIPIGPASSDRIVYVARYENQSGISAANICGVAGTPAPNNLTSPSNAGGWYANVPTGSTCTVTFTDANAANVGIAVWSISGQIGGGSATPSNSLSVLWTTADPITETETINSGGQGLSSVFCFTAAGGNTTVWTGATPVGTDVQSTGGLLAVIGAAQASASGTVSADDSSGSRNFGNGWFNYAAWGP